MVVAASTRWSHDSCRPSQGRWTPVQRGREGDVVDRRNIHCRRRCHPGGRKGDGRVFCHSTLTAARATAQVDRCWFQFRAIGSNAPLTASAKPSIDCINCQVGHVLRPTLLCHAVTRQMGCFTDSAVAEQLRLDTTSIDSVRTWWEQPLNQFALLWLKSAPARAAVTICQIPRRTGGAPIRATRRSPNRVTYNMGSVRRPD
jgi:hypothetical protein